MPSWGVVLREIQKEKDDQGGDSAPDKVRRKYLTLLHKHTGRNVICYYSGFLSKPKLEGIDINDEDKLAFMDCVGGIDRSLGLDLFIHTPGGNGAATASLVDYLRRMFSLDIRAIVPQIAMSAGTLIACSCKEIIMGKHSNIGPVDPQIYGFPANAVIEEVRTAYAEIQKDPGKAQLWHSVLSRYTPGFVQQCYWAMDQSRDFAETFLKTNMFSALPDAERDAISSEIARKLTDLSKNKSHDKHIHIDECKDIGLRIVDLETDKSLQDLVLTVHHCYMYALANTPVFKMVENHVGRRFFKVQQQMVPNLQFMLQPQPQPT